MADKLSAAQGRLKALLDFFFAIFFRVALHDYSPRWRSEQTSET
jgi:hypothetical protein